MRYTPTLAAISICLAIWATRTAYGQANVLPEPNIIEAPSYYTLWPTAPEPPDASRKDSPPAQSVLQACVLHFANWPPPLQEACTDLLREAIQVQRTQIQALTKLQADIGERRAQFQIEHTETTLATQQRQGTVVFWLVVMVVGIGLLAAIAQFARSFVVRDEGGSAEVAISSNEFKFRTTWLGALLLGMSMGFLAIYVVFVYPVRYVGG